MMGIKRITGTMTPKRMRYFDKLVETLETESDAGDKCEGCPTLRRCLPWWDNGAITKYPLTRASYKRLILDFRELTQPN